MVSMVVVFGVLMVVIIGIGDEGIKIWSIESG